MNIQDMDLLELLFWIGMTAVVALIIFKWIELALIIRTRRRQRIARPSLLVVEATVVTKQEKTHLKTEEDGESSAFTAYCATFEFENRDRQEFSIPLPAYNSIAEGDAVQLSLQGKRCIDLRKIV